MKSELENIRWEKLRAGHGPGLRVLLDQAFALKGSNHYLDDFPIWNPAVPIPEERRYQVGGWLGNRLVTTASLRVVGYRWNRHDETKLGLIGAVATHPDFSKRGFAAEAMEFLLLEAMKRKLEVLALWGSESSLYSKRRFRFGGKQIRLPLSEITFLPSNQGAYEFRSGWVPEIVNLLAQRLTGVRYHKEDEAWLSHHKNTKFLTAWKNGKCAGFVAWNRGIDLENIIHECEGELPARLALLSRMKKENSSLELLLHPRTITELTGSTDERTVEFLAQFRTLPTAVFTDTEMDAVWLSGFDAC